MLGALRTVLIVRSILLCTMLSICVKESNAMLSYMMLVSAAEAYGHEAIDIMTAARLVQLSDLEMLGSVFVAVEAPLWF